MVVFQGKEKLLSAIDVLRSPLSPCSRGSAGGGCVVKEMLEAVLAETQRGVFASSNLTPTIPTGVGDLWFRLHQRRPLSSPGSHRAMPCLVECTGAPFSARPRGCPHQVRHIESRSRS